MSVENFLSAVLPSQGHRFILATFGEQGQPDFRPAQRAFAPGEERDAIGFGNWGSTQGANAYFASAGFLPALLNEKTGKHSDGRTSDRVTHFRCVRLDIDCGVGKPYSTKREGFGALVEFINKVGLPMPWLVDSGYGLHVYWAFDRDVTLQEWLPLAQQLATACATHQLQVDVTCTLDAARVLRLPGTNNYKRGGCVPVRIVNEGVAISPDEFTKLFPAVDMMMSMQVPAALRGSPNNDLSANMHAPYTLRGVLTTCPGMAAMIADGGARAQEPLWKAALDLIFKAEDPLPVREKVARAVSVGHPSFDESGFQAKWAQTQKQDYHPPTCKAFRNAGMPECASCPMRERISSPLVLGRPQPQMQQVYTPMPIGPQPDPVAAPAAAVAAAAAAAPIAFVGQTAPPPTQAFQVGIFRVVSGTRVEICDGSLTPKLSIANGVPAMQVEGTKADGTTFQYLKQLLPYRIIEVERLQDSQGARSMTAFTFDRGLDGRVTVEFRGDELVDARSFHTKLQHSLLHVTRKDALTMMDVFMPEFLVQLQRARAANHIATRCGWNDDYSAFVLGTTMYTAKGTSHVRAGGVMEELGAYHAAGDEQIWRDVIDIVLRGGPDRQAVVALAIAGPLMAFAGIDGVMVNAYSPESGVGKSTLGDAALSIWGSPEGLLKSAHDTANATWRLAATMGNMPMVIDEFTNIEGKALSDFVYTMTQGREKHRLTSDAKLQAGGSQRWCLAAITTANNSVHEKLLNYRRDAAAEAARVFDLRLHALPLSIEELAAMKVQLLQLRRNYGFMGPQLVSLFLSKPPAYWRDLVAKKIAKWDTTVARDASDRFRSVAAALMEIGSLIGQGLGLRMDTAGIVAVIESQWRKQLEEFESERKKPADFIESYFTAHMGEFAHVGGASGDAMMSNMPRRYYGELRGRTVDGKFRLGSVLVPIDLLREHVRDANGNFKGVQEWLKEQMVKGLVLRMGRLKFLEGQPMQFTAQAVEFAPNIVGEQPALSIVTTPVAPVGPAKKVQK